MPPLDTESLNEARRFLEVMREGTIEDEICIYPFDIEDEITKSGFTRSRALEILGTTEHELAGFRFAFELKRASDAIIEIRMANDMGNSALAAVAFTDVDDFLRKNELDLPPDAALNALGLTREEFDELCGPYKSFRDDVRELGRRMNEPPEDDPGIGGFSLN